MEKAASLTSVVFPVARARSCFRDGAFAALLGYDVIMDLTHHTVHYGGLFLFLFFLISLLWKTAAKHVVAVSPDKLNVTTSGLLVQWTSEYSLNEINGLRVGYRHILFQDIPVLALDRASSTELFSLRLKVDEAQFALNTLYEKFPQLRPAHPTFSALPA